MAVYSCKVFTGKPWQVPLRVLRLLVMAGLLWWAWREVRPIGQAYMALRDASYGLNAKWELGGRATEGFVTLIGDLLAFQPILWLTDALPYILAGGLVLCAAFERLGIEDNGIRLYFGFRPITLFFVRWDRLRRIEILQHGRHLPTVILHYTNWMHLPSSVGIHSRRYAEGRSVTDTIVTRTVKQGVPGRFLSSPDWVVWAAGLLLLAGVAAGILQSWLMYHGMVVYSHPESPESTFFDLPGPMLLALLFVGAVAAASMGFGMLSAYHRGGPRVGLLVLWVVLAFYALPDPILYWLVHSAIWTIKTAILTPVGPPPDPIPLAPLWQRELALTLVWLAPLIGGVIYFLGVRLGVRRV
ncbi:MAG: hypothetical protein IH851_05595 [Armatimonadetes bacterium]|nr:hypothetical protein [Armatimonadota bacterium]